MEQDVAETDHLRKIDDNRNEFDGQSTMIVKRLFSEFHHRSGRVRCGIGKQFNFLLATSPLSDSAKNHQG